jgi:hypothetical protein
MRRQRDRRVPGEGVEPSRAEAHGFLRPARLPIPPSRPGRPSVTSPTTRTALLVLLVTLAGACGDAAPESERDPPTIAFLYDGAPPDADLVSGPALAGLELAAREAGGVEIEPVNVGEEPEEVLDLLRELGDDRRVLAAVVAPWTAPPPGAIEQLASDGLPVVTLSWAWGPPASGPWRSFVVGRAQEAVALLEAAGPLAPEGASVCLAGDDHPTSRALLATAEELGVAAGAPELVMVGVARVGSAATAEAIAVRIAEAGCAVLAWVGGAPTAATTLESIPEPPTTVGTSRLKTDEGLELAGSGALAFAECVCPDVSLSIDAETMRFVHDVQAESGAPPGPFALEAYDAGTLLLHGLVGANRTRASVAARVAGLTTFVGLATTYAFEPNGSRASPSTAALGRWRAAGSRWLPA